MKQKLIILASVLISFGATARIVVGFHGWNSLEMDSPNIAIVCCGSPTPVNPGVSIQDAPRSDSNVQVVFTLKGTNETSTARLLTDNELCAGKNYLVFGYFEKGIFRAYEEYRVIKLDRFFSTNLIAGKQLDEQIQIILSRRLSDLNGELQRNMAEKHRLEEVVK